MSKWNRMVEHQILKAQAEGKLKGLQGEGERLPDRPGEALLDAGEAAAFRMMAEAGALPEEIALKARMEAARTAWQEAKDPEDKKRLMAELAKAQMRYEIAREARQKFMR